MAEPLISSPTKVATKPAAPQARLILQDPLIYEQATQPVLRSSLEMQLEPAAGLEREKARELWENLSLEPEVAQERQSERKRLLARADTLATETAAAKAQALELQAQLAHERDQRLNHPLVYAGAAGLLGLGALWLFERRTRIQLQERELAFLAEQSPSLMDEDVPGRLPSHISYAVEDSPHLASDYAIDLSGLPGTPSYTEASADPFPAKPTPAASTGSVPVWAQSPVQSKEFTLPSEQDVVAHSQRKQDRSLLGMSKRVLANMIQRKSERDALHSSQYATQTPSSDHENSSVLPTQVMSDGSDHDDAHRLFDEEAQLAFEQEVRAQNFESMHGDDYDPDQTNIELLSQTRVVAQSGENAMEYLLELRTAVSGLTALGRSESAIQLLQEHITADPNTCAWAYLEYMHLCEQTHKRDDFEIMRKAYQRQFNRMAPYWHEPNSNVLGLDGYARAAHELCAAWAQGVQQAHLTLATWLIGPQIGRKLVQLHAYHDMFDLYELLEFVETQANALESKSTGAAAYAAANVMTDAGWARDQGETNHPLNHDIIPIENAEQEFIPTVSLLDLDYEFSSDVTLQEREVRESEKSVTVVKTGNFSVDFNVTGTQIGSLQSLPSEIDKSNPR